MHCFFNHDCVNKFWLPVLKCHERKARLEHMTKSGKWPDRLAVRPALFDPGIGAWPLPQKKETLTKK